MARYRSRSTACSSSALRPAASTVPMRLKSTLPSGRTLTV